jgi:O-antigen/teichoic acid export membrane protein
MPIAVAFPRSPCSSMNGPEDADSEVALPLSDGAGARRLARSAGGTLGLNVLNVAVTIVTTVLLARIMGAFGYGIFAFVAATVTLLGIPAILGVDRLLIRDVAVYAQRGADGLARGLLRRAAQLVLGISILIAVAAALAAWIVAEGVMSAGLLTFWLGVAALPFLALGRVVQAALMGLHHVVLGQAPEYLLRPAVFLALVLVVYATAGVSLDAPLAVLLHGVSLAVACIVSVLILRARTPKSVRQAKPVYQTSRWTWAALSLAFLSGAAVLNSQIGVAMLGALATPESAGVYAVAQRGALLVAFPLSAVNAAIGPTAARLWSAGEADRLQRLVTLSARAILLASLPLALGFVVLGRNLLVVFFGVEFAAADGPLAILAIGQLINAATGSVATLLVMTGNQKRAAVGIMAGAAANIAGAVVLIPVLDAVGAALAATLSLLISNLILVAATSRSLGIHPTALGRIRRSHTSQIGDS